ncbi:AAA family ATPase [Sphaerotilus sp.]|uniref:ATP-binding protein n=1 Tax=Sphaerotilus sp. TaxID=2093942 RepID=UPI00286DBEA6|nr:AAA family ATPase [Sphaerotilus sp.]
MTDQTTDALTPPGGQHRRYLTVVFSDLCDSTRLSGSMESEWYAVILADLRQAYTEVLTRHGGTVVRIQGDGALAIFGYPSPREDDARHATQAALELHEVVRAMAPDTGCGARLALALHSGIHSGLVLLDDGDAVRGRFDLMGTVPNLAARLCEAAGRDEVLVSEEALGPEFRYFETSPLRYVSVKGRVEPMSAYRILGRAGETGRQQARRRRSLLPFIGRGEVLDLLAQRLGQAQVGSLQCVAVLGAAGVGKTRLVQEFLSRQTPLACCVVRGDCENPLSAEPFQPFLQMLRELFGLTHGQTPALAAAEVARRLEAIDPALAVHCGVLLRALSLPDPTAVFGAPPRRLVAEALIGALRDLMAALARQQPLVLALDDWQWADEASRQTLTAVRAIDHQPILVLITARELAPSDLNLIGAEPLQLPPFNDAEAVQTVQHLLPGIDPFEAATIQRYAGGNALFIEELCHSMAQADSERPVGRPHGGAAWLDILIESRLSRLPATQIELLRAAAVIGNVVPTWLLEVVTGCGGDHPLVRALAELDFIFPGERAQTLRFKHGLTRDVIYDSVGLHQRRAMHTRIAQAIQQHRPPGDSDESLEVLAYHYGAAGQTEQAARFAELAGDKALAASSLDRARVQYRAALVALDQLPPSRERLLHWIRLSQRLGLACVFDASRQDLVLFRRAVELADLTEDPSIQAKALYWLAYLHYALGESQACVRHGERALALARQVGDGPLEVQICATLGQALASSADYAPAIHLLREASDIKRQHRSGRGTAVGLAYTLACLAAVQGDRGDFALASALFDEALDVVRDTGHEVGASIRGWRAAVLLWQGRWEEARQTAAEAYRIGEQVRSLFSFSMSRAAGGYAQWMLDGSHTALQSVLDATAWLAPREGGLFESLNHGWLTDGLVRAGRLTEARTHAARALQRGRRRDLLGGSMAARAMAWSAAQAGDLARAERGIARALRVAHARDSAHELAVTQWMAARIVLIGGNAGRARQWLDPAEAAFELMAMPWHLAQARALRLLTR